VVDTRRPLRPAALPFPGSACGNNACWLVFQVGDIHRLLIPSGVGPRLVAPTGNIDRAFFANYVMVGSAHNYVMSHLPITVRPQNVQRFNILKADASMATSNLRRRFSLAVFMSLPWEGSHQGAEALAFNPESSPVSPRSGTSLPSRLLSIRNPGLRCKRLSSSAGLTIASHFRPPLRPISNYPAALIGAGSKSSAAPQRSRHALATGSYPARLWLTRLLGTVPPRARLILLGWEQL